MGSGARSQPVGLTPIAVTRATASDLPEVTALERTCYSDPWPPAAFAVLPANARVFFGVVRLTVNGPIVGYAIAWYVLDEGELANLAVARDARRQGIGRELLQAVLADARARGVRALYLEVRESNVAARELYAAQDFEEVGRRKEYYRSPVEDALILRRTLEPQLI